MEPSPSKGEGAAALTCFCDTDQGWPRAGAARWGACRHAHDGDGLEQRKVIGGGAWSDGDAHIAENSRGTRTSSMVVACVQMMGSKGTDAGGARRGRAPRRRGHEGDLRAGWPAAGTSDASGTSGGVSDGRWG
jgi:hypothetical protein